jgi:hypothetical protein
VRINSDDVAQELYISENASPSSCWRGVRCDWPRSASAQAGCSAVPTRSSPVPDVPGGDGESMRTLAVKMYRTPRSTDGGRAHGRAAAGRHRPGIDHHPAGAGRRSARHLPPASSCFTASRSSPTSHRTLKPSR